MAKDTEKEDDTRQTTPDKHEEGQKRKEDDK